MGDEIIVSAKTLLITTKAMEGIDLQAAGDADSEISELRILLKQMAFKALNSQCGDSVTVKISF